MVGYKVEPKTYSLTEVTYECSNMLCKITCVTAVEVLRILQLPMIPMNPGMDLPVSQL